MRILRDMGMHSTIVQAEAQIERKMELERLDKQYGKVFTKEEIQVLCCKYALKFLRSDNYKGVIDPVIMQKMREFSKETGVELSTTNLGFKFFIMAPSKAFNLQAPERKPVPVDPVLFYKIDENHFRMIHKWGSDFSIFRRIIGWKYTSIVHYFAFFVLIGAVSIGIPLSVLGNSLWYLLLGAGVGFVGTVIAIASIDSTWRNWSDTYDKGREIAY